MASKLDKNSAGDLIVPARYLGKLKGVELDSLRVSHLYEDVLICGHMLPGQRGRPLFYGDLRLFHVAELVALVSSMKKDGSLAMLVPHARKTIHFVNGEIVSASSTVEDDRLGEVFWRRGVLSLEQLAEVHDLVGPGKKLGTILLDKGWINSRQLYEGIKQQILEIVFSTFYFKKGEFLFIEGAAKLPGKVRLDMTTREIIMEGIRRAEELIKLEERFPGQSMVPLKRPVKVDVELDEHQKQVYKLVDGKSSVEKLVTESHLGEFEAMKALTALRQLGLIDMPKQHPEENEESGALPEVLENYAKQIRLIHQMLKVEKPGTEIRIESSLDNPAENLEELFASVKIDTDGRLDVETLYKNANKANCEDPRQLALEAIRGLYDFAVFQAAEILEEETCERMMKKLRRMRKKL